jgi:transposase
MQKIIKYVGLDVHKNSISIAIADQDRDGEVRYYGRIDNSMDQLDKIIRKLISQGVEPRCVYEAGPCGYHIYRHLTGNGIGCSVVAPSLIPRKSGDRQKNDKRDCKTLARLHRSGELTSVYVPDPEDEALRDLVRARKDAQNAHRKAKQQLGAFLLRHNIIYSGKSKWSKAHFNWLADITMPHPAQQITLQEYIDAIHNCQERVNRLSEQVRQQSEQSRLKELIKALQSMRGVSLIVAATLAAELGDLTRFARPGQLMAFLGLIPSEHSSGDKVKKGSITKTGNSHARKVLVEAAQAYRLPARKSRAILKRQEGLPEEIRRISWKAQCRLCGRYGRLTAKGKKSNLVKTAIARELAGFAWAIAHEIPLAA